MGLCWSSALSSGSWSAGCTGAHFGGKPIHGFGSALWFAAVTMTTVGYGDKTPQTPLGRGLAFIWMFLGIVLVSAFTGSWPPVSLFPEVESHDFEPARPDAVPERRGERFSNT